jgi:cell division protein FtsW (lipid II flippase)
MSNGPASSLNYLKKDQTDFHFASVSQETGFNQNGLVLLFNQTDIWRVTEQATNSFSLELTEVY